MVTSTLDGKSENSHVTRLTRDRRLGAGANPLNTDSRDACLVCADSMTILIRAKIIVSLFGNYRIINPDVGNLAYRDDGLEPCWTHERV